jgi:hypothetical protein
MIFIPSCGHPTCDTAVYLDNIGYGGDWSIVVSEDDPCLDGYIDIWGDDRCETFRDGDTDLMDAFGDDLPIGTAAARNHAIDLARRSGHDRCWLFGDDFKAIYEVHPNGDKVMVTDADRLDDILGELERYGREVGAASVGFGHSSSVPNVMVVKQEPMCGYSVAVDDGLCTHSGRMLEDVGHTVRVNSRGGLTVRFHHVFAKTVSRGYDDPDLVSCREAGYGVILAPSAVEAKVRRDGGVRSVVRCDGLAPKILRSASVLSFSGFNSSERRKVLFYGYHTFNENGVFNGGTQVMNDVQLHYFLDRGYQVAYVSQMELTAKARRMYEETYGCEILSHEELVRGSSVDSMQPDLVFISTLLAPKRQATYERLAELVRDVPTVLYSHGISVSRTRLLPDELLLADNVYYTVLNDGDMRERIKSGVDESRITRIDNMYDIGDATPLRTDYVRDVVSNARASSQKGLENIAVICGRMGYDSLFFGRFVDSNNEYMREVRELAGKGARYMGLLPRDRLLEEVSRSRFLGWMPNREEGASPLAVLEAMALGTPVITWNRFNATHCVDPTMNIVLDYGPDFVEQFVEEYVPNLDRYLTIDNRTRLAEDTRRRFGRDAYYRSLDAVIDTAMTGGRLD